MTGKELMQSQIVIPTWMSVVITGLIVALTIGSISWAHNVTVTLTQVATEVSSLHYRVSQIESRE
jgi:hypothetical protein